MTELFTSPRELLAGRLRQMLWLELTLAGEVLPTLRGEARSTDLRSGLERHLVETREHAETLRAVLGELQAPAEPEETPALRGLVSEHEKLVKRVSDRGNLLSDLACAQGMASLEHLELGSYDAMVRLAEALDEEEIGIRLREVMEQEQLALELVDRVEAKLLAEKVGSGQS